MNHGQFIFVAAEVTRLISISDFRSEPPYVGCYEKPGKRRLRHADADVGSLPMNPRQKQGKSYRFPDLCQVFVMASLPKKDISYETIRFHSFRLLVTRVDFFGANAWRPAPAKSMRGSGEIL